MDEPDEVSLGKTGWVQYADNVRGVSLCRYFWPVENPKGVVVLVHGHGAHVAFDFLRVTRPGEAQAYAGSFVEAANKEGLSVCGIDFQGHGRSNSIRNSRCYIERFQHYVDDVHHFVKYLDESSHLEKFHGLPRVVMGASLGGCIALNAIHQKEELFKGAVLLAPMLSLEKVSKTGWNPYLRPLATLLSSMTPLLRVAELKKNTKFPDIQDAFDEGDPLCFHHNTRARVATEYLRATEKTVKEMPEMTFPFVTFHSPEDEMTDFEGSRLLVELAKSQDKQLIEATDMWHFLLKEEGHEKIVKQALAWILQHV